MAPINSNYIKSGSTLQNAITKNTTFSVGVSGGDDYGPTNLKGFYKGIIPPAGGYTIYIHKEVQGPSIHVAHNDEQCIFFLKSFGATGTTISEVLAWSTGRTDLWVQTEEILLSDLSNITPQPTDTPTPTPTVTSTPTPTPTVTSTPTPTPTITNTPIPETSTPTPTPTATSTPTIINPISSGLELYYDPSNSLSYPGSGTTLYDLSPSAVNASISGSPTDSGNWFTFTGTQNIQTGNLAGLYSGWQHTLEIWFNASAAGAVFSDTGSGPTNTGYHSTGLEVYSIGPVYLTNAMLWSSAGVTRVGGGTVSLNNWYQLVRVYNGSNLAYAYLNKVKSSDTSISWITPSPGWYLNFGASETTKFSNGSAFQGKLGVIRLYNRVLSQSEITQNFDAEKSKYGL